jgi:ATP-binding cassette subfamily B protein
MVEGAVDAGPALSLCHESKHFRFLAPPGADLAVEAKSAAEVLEGDYAVLAGLGLVPADEEIDVHLLEIAHGQPPAVERGVDIVPGEEVGLHAFFDPKIRLAWLERDVVKVFVGEVVGAAATRAALLIDGLVGHMVASSGRIAIDSVRESLAARFARGARLLPSTLLFDRGGATKEDYHLVATAFVRHLLDRFGAERFVKLLRTLADAPPEDAALAAFGSPLSVIESAWVSALPQARRSEVGVVDLLRRTHTLIRPHGRAVLGVFGATLFGIAFTAAVPLTTRYIIDHVIAEQSARTLLVILGALLTLFAGQAVVGMLREYLAAHTGSRIADELRMALFERLQALTASFYARSQSGDVVARMTIDVMQVEQTLTQLLPNALGLTLGLLINTLVLFVLEWRLALITMVAIPLVAAGLRWAIPRAGRALGQRQALRGQLGARANEAIQAHSVVKAFGLEQAMTRGFGDVVGELYQVNKRVVFLEGTIILFASLPVALVHLSALGVGAWFVMQGGLSVGSLVAFLSVLGVVLVPLRDVGWVLPAVQRGAAALARLDDILGARPDVSDRPDARPAPRLAREILVDDVTFTYTGEQANLQDVSLRIPAGKSVVFVGPSGCGKSTILSLVMRFYEPNHGAITFDGEDLRSCTQASLRDQIGCVLQDSFLFDVSVRENIRFGKLDATDAQIEAAARAAEIHDAVMQLPQGYDTRVGERGMRLSGGQRQRLAIARALVRDPAIVILDEATSALDSKTEAAINETLARVATGRTILAVTHRLGWAEKADLIYVLEKGRVVESGSHAELLEHGGAYQRLWQRQHSFIEDDRGRIIGVTPDRLRQVPLMADLSDEEITNLARQFRIERHQPGDVIFHEDDPGDRFYVVGHGQVEVETIDPTGARCHLATLRDGDHFGDADVVEGTPRTATITVSAPTDLLALERDAFFDAIAANDALREAVMAGPMSLRVRRG